jgi:TetR/AcrR family transcriptional regulator, transcriptional repressor for nem operon
MNVSKEQSAANHDRILNETARLLREYGGSNVGMDTLAKAVGMTHGSFYSHFKSKESLIAEAIKHGHAAAASRAGTIRDLAHAITAYLSVQHRDNPGQGCFMAALAGSMRGQSADTRRNFTTIVKSNVVRIAGLLSGSAHRKREDQALAIVASMVGAMILSRAVDDSELADRVLTVTRDRLLDR